MQFKLGLIFLLLLVFVTSGLLCSCSSCSDDKPIKVTKETKLDKTKQKIKDFIPIPSDFAEKENAAKLEFDTQKAINKKSTQTLEARLQLCNAQAQAEKPEAKKCYDNFFVDSKDFDINKQVLASAYRWRLIIALRENHTGDISFYWVKLEPLEKQLIKEGRMPLRMQAYSSFIEGGVLRSKGQHLNAISMFKRAIKLHRESGETNNAPLADYMDQLALTLVGLQMNEEALKVLNEREVLLKEILGNVHPMIALNKCQRINVMLDLGDKANARSEWDYVHKIFSSFNKGDIPPSADKLYVETMIRLNQAGFLE